MLKVAVTGASGHIGNVLCRQLLEADYKVRALVFRDHRALDDLIRDKNASQNLELVQGSVLDKDSLDRLVQGCDLVIHSAAVISIHGDPKGIVFKTNTQGPANVIAACVRQGVRKMIHISSTHAVKERPLDRPFDESRPYKQIGDFPYDYSKATGEQIFLKAVGEGLVEGYILRPSSVIGLWDFKPSEMGKAMLDFYRRKIPVLPEGGYNFVDVRDVCASILKSIDRAKNGEIYLITGKYYSLREFSAAISRITGVSVPTVVLPFWFLRAVLPLVKLYSIIRRAAPLFTLEAITALRLGHPDIDCGKARAAFGHSFRPIEETIHDFYEWYRSQNRVS